MQRGWTGTPLLNKQRHGAWGDPEPRQKVYSAQANGGSGSSSRIAESPHTPFLSLQEIIQLSEYLKEALHRELVLKQKMVILQDLLSTLIQASDSSWKVRE